MSHKQLLVFGLLIDLIGFAFLFFTFTLFYSY